MDDDDDPEAPSARRLLAMLTSSSHSNNKNIEIGQQYMLSDAIVSEHSGADNGIDETAIGGEQSTWSLLLSALFYKVDEFDINWSNFILALILVMLMLTTAVGNLFVIVAILIERNLRTIGNYLVLSLAIADLLVALLVMPLAGIYQILERWTLGVLLCDIWTSADVFCCTAIALDRYWAVTRVDYIRCQRNEKRILFMIFLVWMAACFISLGPVFGWKDAQFEWRITNDKECLISQDVGYQIFATCTTFYFPLTLTLIFYWKIYQIARKRIRRKLDNRVKLAPQHPSSTSSITSPSSKLLQLQQHHHSRGHLGAANNQAKCQSLANQLEGASDAQSNRSDDDADASLGSPMANQTGPRNSELNNGGLPAQAGARPRTGDASSGGGGALECNVNDTDDNESPKSTRDLVGSSAPPADQQRLCQHRHPAPGCQVDEGQKMAANCARCRRSHWLRSSGPTNVGIDEEALGAHQRKLDNSGGVAQQCKSLTEADPVAVTATNSCASDAQSNPSAGSSSSQLSNNSSLALKTNEPRTHQSSLCDADDCCACCYDNNASNGAHDQTGPQVGPSGGEPPAAKQAGSCCVLLDAHGQVLCALVNEPDASDNGEAPLRTGLGGGQQGQGGAARSDKRRTGAINVLCSLVALLQMGPLVAICWRRLVARMSDKHRGSTRHHFRPADSSINRRECTILVDEHGHSAIVANGELSLSDNGSPCQACQCPAASLAFTDEQVGRLAQRKHAYSLDGLAGPGMGALTNATSALSAAAGPASQPPPTTTNDGSRTATVQPGQSLSVEGVESKRERKAAKTLSIITGVFVMCWLPFFIMAITMPLLKLKPHKYVFAFLLWLGYVNSMLNPIIYTIFSPDFRKAFKRLLCGMEEDNNGNKRRRRWRNGVGGAYADWDELDNHCGPIRQRLARIHPLLAGLCCCCCACACRRSSSSWSTPIKANRNNKPRADTKRPAPGTSCNSITDNGNQNHLLGGLRGAKGDNLLGPLEPGSRFTIDTSASASVRASPAGPTPTSQAPPWSVDNTGGANQKQQAAASGRPTWSVTNDF